MSVVVRMEMPTSCEECHLVQTYENDWGDVMSRTCNLIYKGYLSDVPKGERRADCPIVCALPDGHGRLVDADTVVFATPNDTMGDVPPMLVTVDDLIESYDVPTIVPADKAERSEA